MVICLQQGANDLHMVQLMLRPSRASLQPNWFNHSGGGLPRLSWKRHQSRYLSYGSPLLISCLVYVCMLMSVCVLWSVCVCLCECAVVCMSACMLVSLCRGVYVCLYACVSVCMSVCVYLHVAPVSCVARQLFFSLVYQRHRRVTPAISHGLDYTHTHGDVTHCTCSHLGQAAVKSTVNYVLLI